MLNGGGGAEGWDADKFALALTAAVVTCGHLWQRCVRPFLTWPWLLAVLVAPEASDADKRTVAQ
eukprot:15257868-Alexandrium_andersonii.AAC.1